ncbi:hypothetical protein B0H15DRAFT_923109 [Mycena belliarum]|uniref:CxC2-like cysteine cluster KDZ transposase-associated domain-containing protein n=1 Tax=Mycena belliarum TaxID=1033014 RepID=A0AAD6XR71_9AGAR|nr:hypothetical protein B0H15DRAFT_923109 [Mycena belliae]
MASSSRPRKRSRHPATEIFEWTLEEVVDAPSFSAQSVSSDKRRTNEKTYPVDLPSPLKKIKVAPIPFKDVGEGFEYVFEDLDAPPVRSAPSNRAVKPRAKRYLSSDRPLAQWVPLHDKYLAEIITHEGRGYSTADVCPSCPTGKEGLPPPGKPEYRCMECLCPDLVCSECCLREHRARPLDRIEHWTGECFQRVTLKSLGMRVQLGHTGWETCGNPVPGHQNFTVIHTNGLHPVAVDFCGCGDGHAPGQRSMQLLRMLWYPSTDAVPQTAATFRVLEMFHIMTLQGKVTTYDFYSGLEKLTDNTGMTRMKDRYKSFMRMMREWRHVTMLKRAGRGNDGTRPVAQTHPGELAVKCPACPRPGINLPEDWAKAEGTRREQLMHTLSFLYILFLAIDACFRLKRRLVSSVLKDPALGSGWAYFTEDAPYREFLLTVTDQKEMSTCSGLAALDYANTKFSRGYGATGVGLGVCARHEFVQANGAGDLQKGERYANMDYIFASLLRHHDAGLLKYVSYDICCQWSKHLIERLKKLPSGLRLTLVFSLVRFLIPKLHIYGHKILCQLLYSLNYILGSARTDGEGIERPWANIGPVATSTREMGPGSRLDTLDDHWSHWNWQKLVGLGLLLLKRLHNAISERNFQEESLATFTALQAEHVPEWKAMVEAFDADDASPNPYELPKIGINEHDVRLQLAEEEASEAMPIHNVSPSAFILAGLDLEEQQRRLRIEVETRRDITTKQTAEMLEKRTKLGRYTARFRTLQQVYTPAALQALSEHPAPPPGKKAEEAGRVENTPLYLPSALTEAQRMAGCFKGVVKIEERLRYAQCRSSLAEIRHLLHIKSRFRTYKGGHARHQGATTRSRNIMNRNDAKIRIQAEKYVAAWEAKRRLVGIENVGWNRLNPKKDLRCMDSEEDRALRSKRKVLGKKRRQGEPATAEDKQDGVGEGQRRKGKTGEGIRVVSWIWMGADASTSSTDEAILKGLRVEWAKAWARTKRWTEEVDLLKEEMRRVPISLRWQARWWADRREVDGRMPEHAEGTRAYAARQEDLRLRLANHFETLWAGCAEMEGIDGIVDEEVGEDENGDGEEEDDDEAPEPEGEERLEGDEEGSIGGEDDNVDDE